MDKKSARIRRAAKTRYKLKKIGATRLVIHKTPRHIYAQVIASNGHEVLASAATTEKNLVQQLSYTGNKNAAVIIGRVIAKRALKKEIKYLSFDRSGFRYHGRIKALADSAREIGLQF